ncbi:MAG: SDR family oxidoreductase [Pleurocapsa sp. SU_196_0]|nr:SDR family oxidoreductase [Pleurocapsa sp. SU_196_0]
MQNLSGKVALVTGAAGEIGTATARLMAARGARLALTDVKLEGLSALKSELEGLGAEVLTVAHDVRLEASWAEVVGAIRTRFGALHVLVNNAGIGGAPAAIPNYSLESFEAVMAVNVTGVFLGMKHAIPLMLEGGTGSIVNISSVAGVIGSPGMIAYNASKHAVIGLTRGAAAEWSRKGIRVNSVNPGPLDSSMMRGYDESLKPGEGEKVREHLERLIPLRRYGTPAEIAQVIAFLASDDSSLVTGAVYLADGGLHAV